MGDEGTIGTDAGQAMGARMGDWKMLTPVSDRAFDNGNAWSGYVSSGDGYQMSSWIGEMLWRKGTVLLAN
jgi:hypothetical protein